MTTPAPNAADTTELPRWTESLRDGTRVVVRPLTRVDAAREREFIAALSPQTLRFRFLGQVRQPSEALISQLTDMDFRRDVAFAAVVPLDADEKILGVSRYSATEDGLQCECAVTVLDDWHRRGLGTLLMRHLIEVAKMRGIVWMYSIDSAENTEMAELARFLGFSREIDPQEPGQVVHRLKLQAGAASFPPLPPGEGWGEGAVSGGR
jgi:GNAT superfamily N-acetyltransferase